MWFCRVMCLSLSTLFCAVGCQIVDRDGAEESRLALRTDLRPGEVRWGEANNGLRAGLATAPLPGERLTIAPLYLRLQWVGPWKDVEGWNDYNDRDGLMRSGVGAFVLGGEPNLEWNPIAEVTLTLADGRQFSLPRMPYAPERPDLNCVPDFLWMLRKRDTLSWPIPWDQIVPPASKDGSAKPLRGTLRVRYSLGPVPDSGFRWNGEVETPPVEVTVTKKTPR